MKSAKDLVMADQNSWNEERARASSPYQHDVESDRGGGSYQSSRDALGDRGEDRNSREYRRTNEFAARRSQGDNHGARGDAYGIPSDYTFGRDRGDRFDRSFGQAYGRDADYGAGRYGQAFSGQDYSRSYGADRYEGAGRAQEDRSFWSQTRDEVSSWFGDDEARRRRQQDEMRSGEHRGRGPKGYARSDDRIRDDVSDLLSDNDRLDASDIEVAVSGAEVTLNGTVSQKGDKRLAEDLAESISGVKHVQNNLRMKDFGSGAATRIPVAGTVGTTGSSVSGAAAAGAGQAGTQTRTN
jgi:osmotically-inducible protein OsmY